MWQIYLFGCAEGENTITAVDWRASQRVAVSR